MRLTFDRNILARFSDGLLLAAILERRQVIRGHRDARGDDRCWLDDYLVWAMLDDSAPASTSPPPLQVAMMKCREFYRLRRADFADPIPTDAIINPALWNQDLRQMTRERLLDELVKIQEAIRRHRDIPDSPRIIDDDRALYSVLPENIPADFRLPPEEEFIGAAKAPAAGCPAFWRSHLSCQCSRHNLHQWGPCKE